MVYANLTPGEVVAAGVAFLALCPTLTALRLYARRAKGTRWSLDDWLVIPAAAFLVGMCIASLVGVANKSVAYLIPPPPHDQLELSSYKQHNMISPKIYWSTQLMQVLSLGFVKLSFVLFFRRVFNVKGHTAWFNVITTASIALLVVWALGFCLAMLLMCPGHLTAYWSPLAHQKYCWDTTNFLLTYCFSDLATDILVFLLPIAPLWKLQMALKRKIAIAGVFSVGAITIAASITRAVLYVGFLEAENGDFDGQMLNTNGNYWMIIESGLALCVVNLPIIYGHFRVLGAGSFIEYARNFMSLKSARSSEVSDDHDSSRPWMKEAKSDEMPSSDIHMAYGTSQLETRADRGSSISSLEEGLIHVSKTVNVK